MRIILLNGPKLSGKTAAATQYVFGGQMHGALARLLPMSQPMKLLAVKGLSEAISYPHDDLKLLDYMNEHKDEKIPELMGKTPRQFWIDFGRDYWREHGDESIADLWLKEAAKYTHECTELVVCGVRRPPEVSAAVTLAGRENVMLVHVKRDGANWSNDIGSYLPPADGKQFTLHNNGPENRLGATLEQLVFMWLNNAEFGEAWTGAVSLNGAS